MSAILMPPGQSSPAGSQAMTKFQVPRTCSSRLGCAIPNAGAGGNLLERHRAGGWVSLEQGEKWFEEMGYDTMLMAKLSYLKAVGSKCVSLDDLKHKVTRLDLSDIHAPPLSLL